MYKLALVLILIPLMASADLGGYATPKAAIEAITGPLKKGSKGVADSMKAADSLNGDSSQGKYKELEASLTKDLKDNGKVVKSTMVDSDSRLNGNYQVFTYELEYLNGKKRQVQIKLLKPSQNAGFHVMGLELDP